MQPIRLFEFCAWYQHIHSDTMKWIYRGQNSTGAQRQNKSLALANLEKLPHRADVRV